MAKEVAKQTIQQVKPIISVDSNDARRRVMGLYKAWIRQLPFVGE